MTEAQIKHMVDRFLAWQLPESFAPDGGVSFKRFFNEGTPYQGRNDPSGTNILNADEATAMVRHMVADMPAADRNAASARAELGILRALLSAYVADENRYNRGEGEPYGTISTELGMRARAAIAS